MSEKKPTIDDFTVLLKQTVEAKRLSGGKVQEIVQTGVKFLKDDLTLLTTLYKTHKSLPPKSSAKISSLYILDSLCRGVYKLKDKDKNKDGDGKTAGLARGFLSKVEGVLEGWARDMCEGWSEGREKMIKILDIWTKSQTFSPAALARVQGIIDQTAPTGTANAAATGTSTGVSSANNGMPSTTPPGSPPAKVVGGTNGVVGSNGPAAGASGGTDTPPIMPDFLSFLSTQIQSVGAASPSAANQVGSPSTTVPIPTNLAFLNGILPPQNAAASPAQGSYSPNVNQNIPQNAAFPPLAANPIGNNFAENRLGQITTLPAPTLPIPTARPGQTDLGAAMAKRDEIAKKFAMMGQGPNKQSAPTITPSIPPPSNMPLRLPTGDNFAAPPATQYHQGLSRGQPFPDRSDRIAGNERYPVRNGGGWNSPPNPGGFDQNAASSSSAWRPNPHGRSRSRSPSRTMNRPEAVRQGRAPLPGAGQPGKDEFGRDVVSRRSASPQRDRPDYQRPRTDSAHDLGTKPVDHANQTKPLIKLEDLDITTLNPVEAKTWEVLGEAWINTHGRPPEGPDVMMWFMNATAEKMSSTAGMNGNVMGNVMTGAMPDMTGLTPTMNMMPMDNSHQQARLDWNDDGPYSGGGAGGSGGGGQRGGGAGGRGRW